MMSSSKAIALMLSLAAMAGLTAGCAQESTVTWQPDGMPHHTHPNQNWWSYEFVYHPNAQVYFEPYTHQYFWFQDGWWHRGDQPPQELTLDPTLARVVKLQQTSPYPQHGTVLAWHPCHRYMPPAFDPRLFDQIPVRVANYPD
jgi:hypothetical protein